MSILAWRVVPRQFSEPPFNPFDGEGASMHGGRWNSKGTPVVYTSASVSLAILEKLVHSEGKVSALLGCVMFELTIPDNLVWIVPPASLPAGWDTSAGATELKPFGDAWVSAAQTPVMRIPSAVVATEFNFVLNPRHPEFPRLAIGGRQPLPIDPRLLGGA